MKGKSYNRGLRLHKLMNEALNRVKWLTLVKQLSQRDSGLEDKVLHEIADGVKACLNWYEDIGKAQQENQKDLQKSLDNFMMVSQPLFQMMDDFTLHGRQSSDTFCFWDNYVSDYSQLLLDYVAAKRDDCKSVEIETFSQMLPLDFMCGHVNYARWGVISVAEAKYLGERKPHIYDAISNGHGSVHHSTKPFSGVWHDMAIEQTLNKECGKYQHLCTKEEALEKFYLTAHMKAAATAMVHTMSGINKSGNDLHKEATQSRIDKDENDIEKIVNVISERMVNPFELEDGASLDNKQPLMNIANSTVDPLDVTESLCNIRKIGEQKMDEFIKDRVLTNEKGFFNPLSKPALKTFASLNKPLISKQKQATKAINIDREIFSKLAIVAKSREIDIAEILQFELTSVPLSLFTLDQSMRKTIKSKTLSWMEKDLGLYQIPSPGEPTLFVIDFMMLLKMVCTDASDCETFGELSDRLLNIVLNQNYKYTAVVGDSYSHAESIKSGERARRGAVQMQEVRNPSQNTPLPKQRQKMLSNPQNKMNIADFIMKYWINICEEKLDHGQHMYLAGGFRDPTRAVLVEKGQHILVDELTSDHEEADSRMFLHIAHGVETLHVKRVILWSIDSDVAALCPRYCIQLGLQELYFKTGKAESKRYIPMHTVAVDIGRDMSLVLPTLHALSGCDSTSSFSGKGKLKWMNTLQSHPELIDGLQEIGSDPLNISARATSACSTLVGYVYQNKAYDSLDVLRYDLFTKRNVSSDKLPPTMDAFSHHLKRTNYQTYIWIHATEPLLHMPSPIGQGWIVDHTGHIVPELMTKPSAPEAILAFVQCKCKSDCSSRRCKCRKEDLLCTDACGCQNETCENRTLHGLLSGSESDSEDE